MDSPTSLFNMAGPSILLLTNIDLLAIDLLVIGLLLLLLTALLIIGGLGLVIKALDLPHLLMTGEGGKSL